MALQIRRGLQANLPANPAEGELLYATDSGNLYIGVSGSPQLISFSGSGGGGGNSNVQAISDLSDVASISGISNGQALLWNAANNSFEYGDIPASYGDADVETLLATKSFANTTFVTGEVNTANTNMQAYVDDQVATLNTTLTTANVNMQTYVDAQINNLVDGAPAALDTLAEVANALNSSNAQLSAVAFSGDFNDITNTPTLTLSNSSLTYDGVTVDLSGVVGVTGATGPQGNAGVDGADGTDGTDGISITNATVIGDNLNITLSNATTIVAGNVRGPQGNVGPQGPQGIQGDGNAGISSATVTGTNLVLTLADGSTVNAGNVVGPQGAAGNDGADGADGVGITSTSIVGGSLIFNYSNTSTQNVGNIQGPQGDQGIQGPQGNVGLTGATGPQGNVGPQGPAGVDVSSASVNGSGNLIITLSDSSTLDAGNVKGSDGLGTAVVQANAPSNPVTGDLWYDTDDAHTYIYTGATWAQANPGQSPQTLSLAGNVITISGSNSNVDLTTILGAVDTDTDAQNLSLAGNVISLTGQTGNVDLTGLLGAYVNTDSQTLALAGNTLTISGGNSVDLSSFAGGGGLADLSSNVIADLSDVSSTAPTDGQALVWDNGNSTWAPGTVSSGGGATALGDLSDVSTAGASSGQVLKYNGSSWAPAADSTGSGGGGGGAVMERFKLNYASNGALSTVSDLTSGINTVTINSTTGGEVTIEFSSYNYPPGSIIFYGYDYTNNTYAIVPMETSMGFREIPAGGTSGSPTLFDGTNTLEVKLRLREAETGASRGGFGTTTHAWIQFLMYD